MYETLACDPLSVYRGIVRAVGLSIELIYRTIFLNALSMRTGDDLMREKGGGRNESFGKQRHQTYPNFSGTSTFYKTSKDRQL